MTRQFPKRGETVALTSTDDSLRDANEVARFLKVSRSWVNHRAESGQLPHMRVGGLLRFDPKAIFAHFRLKYSDPLWEAADVATFLKVSQSWVYHHAESGEIDTIRVGGLLRFEPRAILARASGATANHASLVAPHVPATRADSIEVS